MTINLHDACVLPDAAVQKAIQTLFYYMEVIEQRINFFRIKTVLISQAADIKLDKNVMK